MSPVEFCCEERVGCLRSAIGDPWVVCLLLSTRIVQVNIGDAMSLGRQHYQRPVIGKQRLDPVDQSEMTKMVGPELDFEAIDRPTERS